MAPSQLSSRGRRMINAVITSSSSRRGSAGRGHWLVVTDGLLIAALLLTASASGDERPPWRASGIGVGIGSSSPSLLRPWASFVGKPDAAALRWSWFRGHAARRSGSRLRLVPPLLSCSPQAHARRAPHRASSAPPARGHRVTTVAGRPPGSAVAPPWPGVRGACALPIRRTSAIVNVASSSRAHGRRSSALAVFTVSSALLRHPGSLTASAAAPDSSRGRPLPLAVVAAPRLPRRRARGSVWRLANTTTR